MAVQEVGPQEVSPDRHYWFQIGAFRWILLGMAVIAAFGVGITQYFTAHYESEVLKIVGSICEAVLIAAVIGLVVDPYLKKHFVGEVGPEYFWVTRARSIPPTIRAKVEELASHAEYMRSVNWTLRFSWCDEDGCADRHLKVDIRAEANGYTTNVRGYVFKPYLWLTPSGEPHESRHTSLEFSIPQEDEKVKIGQTELQRIKESKEPPKEWLKIAKAQLGHYPEVPQGATFVVCRDSVNYPSGNLLPFRIRYITLAHNFELTGEALRDLEIVIDHATGENTKCEPGMARILETAPQLAFPGQVTVISWKIIA